MRRRRALPVLVGLISALIGLVLVPRLWCGRDAGAWLDGDVERTRALGAAVDRELGELGRGSFSTGSARFDGEWRFGTATMAAMGFGQTAAEHPSERALALERMERALASALAEDARRFDTEAWGADALDTLERPEAHAAYLGYLGLGLSLHRFLSPGGRYADLDERVTAALARRLEAAPGLVLETYPGEIYPVDNAAAVAAIALRDRALGQPPRPIVARFVARARARFVDRDSGLLFQAVGPEGREPVDAPRGSGTALAAYFLSFADRDFARELALAVERRLAADVLGFGVVSEYPGGVAGFGDIDSGPLVLGWSISAMGFSLGAFRAHGRRDGFVELYRSFHLLGAPIRRGGEARFVAGGPLGDAIVFAMLTAQPAERWGRR